MKQTHEIKRGDTRPRIESTLPITLSANEIADVTLLLEHEKVGPLGEFDTEITDRPMGEVAYQLTEDQTTLDGELLGEYLVHYENGDKRTFPRNGFIEIPLNETLNRELEAADLEYKRDVDLSLVNAEALDLNDHGEVIRLDGSNLEIDENGELSWVNPDTDGYVEGGAHDHSGSSEGGDTLRPENLEVSGASSERHWELLYEWEQQNALEPFQISTVLDRKDEYRLTATWRSLSDSNPRPEIRLNAGGLADDSGAYQYLTLSDTGIGSYQSEDSILLADIGTDATGVADYTFSFGPEADPYVFSIAGSGDVKDISLETLMRGSLATIPDTREIEIYTDIQEGDIALRNFSIQIFGRWH